MRNSKKMERRWLVWYLSGTIVVLDRLAERFNIDTRYTCGSIRRILRELREGK